MTSFLGVPVTVHGRSVGNLYLTDKQGAAEFSDVDQLLVEMFALRAGIAIDNAHLHEQVQRLAVVEERERIGRDLHDGIIQSIYGVALSLEDVPFLMRERARRRERPRRQGDRFAQSDDPRDPELHPRSPLGAAPRSGSGRRACDARRRIREQRRGRHRARHRASIPRSQASCRSATGCRSCRWPAKRLSNAVRHSQAGRVTIGLHDDGPSLELSVEDDGIGFDPDVAPRPGHLGLANLRDRTAALGGTLTIQSQPGHGTSPPDSGADLSTRRTRGAQPHDRSTPAHVLRLLVVDDHEVVRQGLAALLDRREGFQVVAEAGTVAESLEQARRHQPDIVVMDVRLPDGSGIEACREIRAEMPATRVVMLTSYPDEEAVLSAIVAGASGYLLKQVRARDLVAALEAVGRGESLLDPAVTEKVLERIRRIATGSQETDELSQLTSQERKILMLLAEGKTNKEIAAEIYLSDKTVKNYVSSILAKLNLERRAQAAAFVAKHRLDRGGV